MTKNNTHDLILMGVGGNLPHPDHGPPPGAGEAALEMLTARGIRVTGRSPWYLTSPVPPGAQPDFVNGVARLAWDGEPDDLLAVFHAVEAALGRRRSDQNAPRTVDLDLLDFRGRITPPGAPGAVLPHPRMGVRAFVLVPLRDVAPAWRHPATGEGLETLISRLPDNQIIRRLGAPGGGSGCLL